MLSSRHLQRWPGHALLAPLCCQLAVPLLIQPSQQGFVLPRAWPLAVIGEWGGGAGAQRSAKQMRCSSHASCIQEQCPALRHMWPSAGGENGPLWGTIAQGAGWPMPSSLAHACVPDGCPHWLQPPAHVPERGRVGAAVALHKVLWCNQLQQLLLIVGAQHLWGGKKARHSSQQLQKRTPPPPGAWEQGLLKG